MDIMMTMPTMAIMMKTIISVKIITMTIMIYVIRITLKIMTMIMIISMTIKKYNGDTTTTSYIINYGINDNCYYLQ